MRGGGARYIVYPCMIFILYPDNALMRLLCISTKTGRNMCLAVGKY